jgi:hypothetical protein
MAVQLVAVVVRREQPTDDGTKRPPYRRSYVGVGGDSSGFIGTGGESIAAPIEPTDEVAKVPAITAVDPTALTNGDEKAKGEPKALYV